MSRRRRSRSRSRSRDREKREKIRPHRQSRSTRNSRTQSRSPVQSRDNSLPPAARPIEELDPNFVKEWPSSIKPESLAIRNAWDLVLSEKDNFDHWMNLVNVANNTDEMDIVRGIFCAFLKKYPYCFGFWIKYADYEKKRNNFVDTIEVYEQGVRCMPLCVDLWLSYITFMRQIAPNTDEGRAQLATLHSRAIENAGITFVSDKLYDDILGYYMQTKQWRHAARVYELLLLVPTAGCRRHFENYVNLVNTHEPDEILDSEEYSTCISEVRSATNLGIDDLITMETVCVQNETDLQLDTKPVIKSVRRHNPVALEYIRRKVTAEKALQHEKTAIMVNSRLPYEEKLGRQYFHVKPLEFSQLKAWNNYLDFEISEGSAHRTEQLFNRALVSCARYETMWIKFALWSRDKYDLTAAVDIFARAVIHCPKSVVLTLARSALYEEAGEYSKALKILTEFEELNPGYAAIEIRKLGLLRRKISKQSKDKKGADFTDVVRQMENMINTDGTASDISSYHALKLARFHLRCRRDRPAAEKVLKRAIDKDRSNVQLHLQLIDIVLNDPEFSQSRFLDAMDDALDNTELNIDDRIRISQRKLEFLEDIGLDVQELNNHTLKHQQLVEEMGQSITIRRLAGGEAASTIAGDPKWDHGQVPQTIAPPVISAMGQPAMFNMPPPVFVQPTPFVPMG